MQRVPRGSRDNCNPTASFQASAQHRPATWTTWWGRSSGNRRLNDFICASSRDHPQERSRATASSYTHLPERAEVNASLSFLCRAYKCAPPVSDARQYLRHLGTGHEPAQINGPAYARELSTCLNSPNRWPLKSGPGTKSRLVRDCPFY
jgi:hypothetical protein